MPSNIIPAAKLAASKAFISQIIKESETNTCAPIPPPTTPDIVRSSNTPGRLPTPPSSPAGSPTIEDNSEQVKVVRIAITKRDKKGKGKATDVVEKDTGNHGPPAPESESEPELISPSPSHSYARKLVTVRKINAVDTTNHHYTKLTIDGWTVGIKRPSKSIDFKAGDRCIFLEPDTLLPADHPQPGYRKLFAQVGNPITSKDGRNWFRVGTRTLGNPRFPRWQFVSQGYVFPLQEIPEIHDDVMLRTRLVRFGSGDEEQELELVDYSAVLGAMKWDPHGESKSTGGSGGNASSKSDNTPTPIVKKPSFIQKTDSERVQNCLNLFIKPKYKNIVYQESVKIDGASMTCYFVPKQSKYFKQLHNPHPGPLSAAQSVFETGRFGICSKIVDLPFSEDCPYWAAAIANDMGALLENLHKEKTGLGSRGGALAIQGELVGPTISGNHYGLPSTSSPSFTVYSVWDIEAQNRWDPRAVQKFCSTHGLSHVEVLGYHKVTDIAGSHADLIARANGRQGEGLVFKSCAGDGRWFKVLSDRWITERGDEVDAARVEVMQATDVEATAKHSAVKAAVGEQAAIEEKHSKKKAGELSDTPSPNHLDSVQEYLAAPVIWLGRRMTHKEAILEIGRVILTEMALHSNNAEACVKELVEVVSDELKFLANDSPNVAEPKMETKEDMPADATHATSNTPTIPSTPTSPDTPATRQGNNPATDAVMISEAVTGPAEQIIAANPTPPASEHNSNNNDEQINWDDYKVFKRGGQMICIRREDYRPRSPPCMYASAEEMARRREARRSERQRRYRFLGE
ncbi:hypothetical protein QBC45DRAFT_324260 [Copromyces sp. CBS 386.78]|nr:hypothetical protein QBC45DRAFT_324260 [Copromyces sp. CBS 386.78]